MKIVHPKWMYDFIYCGLNLEVFVKQLNQK
jgi:hypothetical protein